MKSDDFNLSYFLPYQLAILSSRISKLLSKVYGDRYGLSIPEWRVLVHVARREKMSVREIHKCVNFEKPTVSRAVSKLEDTGLVAKTASVQDQRLVEIELTEAGFDVLKGITQEARSFEENILGEFSEADRHQLYVLMERLHDGLDKHPEAANRPPMDIEARSDLLG
ncbi:MarR family winged helix-turn-helix transcriptional regulator [Litoreibacter halocynthiae]|uniref:MarR family winged helix-turn-helix transcriptional regulator n=1 Tax=Litoreibacter halocynthiae TaxID=1242689 RepID=UPI0024907500|nr:MarR family transcriptional regulator [Litoreibacter halocynthiae]